MELWFPCKNYNNYTIEQLNNTEVKPYIFHFLEINDQQIEKLGDLINQTENIFEKKILTYHFFKYVEELIARNKVQQNSEFLNKNYYNTKNVEYYSDDNDDFSILIKNKSTFVDNLGHWSDSFAITEKKCESYLLFVQVDLNDYYYGLTEEDFYSDTEKQLLNEQIDNVKFFNYFVNNNIENITFDNFDSKINITQCSNGSIKNFYMTGCSLKEANNLVNSKYAVVIAEYLHYKNLEELTSTIILFGKDEVKRYYETKEKQYNDNSYPYTSQYFSKKFKQLAKIGCFVDLKEVRVELRVLKAFNPIISLNTSSAYDIATSLVENNNLTELEKDIIYTDVYSRCINGEFDKYTCAELLGIDPSYIPHPYVQKNFLNSILDWCYNYCKENNALNFISGHKFNYKCNLNTYPHIENYSKIISELIKDSMKINIVYKEEESFCFDQMLFNIVNPLSNFHLLLDRVNNVPVALSVSTNNNLYNKIFAEIKDLNSQEEFKGKLLSIEIFDFDNEIEMFNKAKEIMSQTKLEVCRYTRCITNGTETIKCKGEQKFVKSSFIDKEDNLEIVAKNPVFKDIDVKEAEDNTTDINLITFPIVVTPVNTTQINNFKIKKDNKIVDFNHKYTLDIEEELIQNGLYNCFNKLYFPNFIRNIKPQSFVCDLKGISYESASLLIENPINNFVCLYEINIDGNITRYLDDHFIDNLNKYKNTPNCEISLLDNKMDFDVFIEYTNLCTSDYLVETQIMFKNLLNNLKPLIMFKQWEDFYLYLKDNYNHPTFVTEFKLNKINPDNYSTLEKASLLALFPELSNIESFNKIDHNKIFKDEYDYFYSYQNINIFEYIVKKNLKDIIKELFFGDLLSIEQKTILYNFYFKSNITAEELDYFLKSNFDLVDQTN